MDNQLAEIIAGRIEKEGPISFEQFMAMALYHPGLGYYTSTREIFGPAGDYYTSPEVHPIFGRVLAGQFQEMWERLGCPGGWQLVEYGAGKGFLARDVLTFLRRNNPRCFDALSYYIIEAGPFLIKRQQMVLEEAGLGAPKVKWVETPGQTHGGGGVTGAFLSNELVDALPFHRVRLRPDGLKEIYVGYINDQFAEVEGPPSRPELALYLEEEGVALEVGQSAEINLHARQWLRTISENLGRGFVVTIDYGGLSKDLYHSRRFNGTLRSFRRHRLVENPLEAIGSQDITASVNFSSLRRWGGEVGLREAGFLSQADFLINAGILEMVGRPDDYQHDQEYYNTVNAVKKIILPGGMGSVFKVLIQYKAFAEKPELSGTTRRFNRL